MAKLVAHVPTGLSYFSVVQAGCRSQPHLWKALDLLWTETGEKDILMFFKNVMSNIDTVRNLRTKIDCISNDYQKMAFFPLWPTDPMNNAITLDDYQNFQLSVVTAEQAVVIHHFFLTNCLVYITHSDRFMVKIMEGNGFNWVPMKITELKRILDAKSLRFIRDEKIKTCSYSAYLKEPMITQNFVQFVDRDFCKHHPDDKIFPEWNGFEFPLVKPVDMNIIHPFLDHVLQVICDGNQEYYEVEMKKNAWIFQNPLGHMGWVTVLVGEEGTGKNRYTDILCALWGPRYATPNLKSLSQITDEKSYKILHNKKIIVVNELPDINSRQGRSTPWDKVKPLITDDTLTVREMRRDFGDTPEKNINNYFFLTNNVQSVKIPEDDRRYFPLRVSSKRKRSPELTKLYDLQFDPVFLSHLLTYLLNLDTTGLNRYQPLETELKREIMEGQKMLLE
jgi:hypothetical protein